MRQVYSIDRQNDAIFVSKFIFANRFYETIRDLIIYISYLYIINLIINYIVQFDAIIVKKQ